MSSASNRQVATAAGTDQLVVRPFASQDEAEWDRVVERSPESTFFHRAGWARVLQDSFGHRPYYRVAERDGRIEGILPLVHVRSRLFGNRLVSTPFCVRGGPIAAQAQTAQALTDEALSLAEDLDVDYVEYRGLTAPGEGWVEDDATYANFERDLEQDLDTELKRIPRKQRAVVRKSLDNGLADEIDSDPERFRRLYGLSLRNLGTPMFPRTYFDNLLGVFGESCEIQTICKDGQAICSVLSFYFRDRVMPYYTGGLATARQLGANDFMYWRLMRRASEAGYRVFDFGRSKVGSGPYSFKKNWGFAPEPVVHSYRLRRSNDLPAVNPNNPRYAMLATLWRHLPLPVANALGPWIVRGAG